MSCDETTLAKLDDLAAAIGRYDDPRKAPNEWKQAFRLLQGTGLPAGRINGVVGMRDLTGLRTLIEQIRSPQDAPPAQAPDEETCRRALQAFRKRLALTVLDEESKLGRSPLSKGSDASAPAIIPPDEWPQAVWQHLVRQGKLRYIGHGFYARAD